MGGASNIIKSCPLFYEMYDMEIDEFVKDCRVISYKDGEYLVRQDSFSSEIQLILSGTADVYKNGHYLTKLKKGDLIGELVLLNQNKREADIVASSHTDTLVVEYDYFYSFFHKNPKFFSLLSLNLARLLAKRLVDAGNVIKKAKMESAELKEKLEKLGDSK